MNCIALCRYRGVTVLPKGCLNNLLGGQTTDMSESIDAPDEALTRICGEFSAQSPLFSNLGVFGLTPYLFLTTLIRNKSLKYSMNFQAYDLGGG